MDKEYIGYIQSSPTWQKKRTKRLQIDDFKCAKCGSAKHLQVHHLNYDNLYDEDVYTDLITLCKDCHDEIESIKKTPNNETAWKNIHLEFPFNTAYGFTGVSEIYRNDYKDYIEVIPMYAEYQADDVRFENASLYAVFMWHKGQLYISITDDLYEENPYYQGSPGHMIDRLKEESKK